MFYEEYSIFAYWPVRPETLVDCAQRFVNLLERLAEVDPIFAHWVESSNAPPKHDITLDDIKRLLSKSTVDQLSNPFGNYEADGWSMSIDNEKAPKISASIHIVCGRTGRYTFHNWVRVAIFGNALKRLTAQTATKVIQCMVDIMEPDWAVAKPFRLLYMKSQRAQFHPKVGWITYLAKPPRPLPTFSLPSHAKPFADGVLITTTDELLVQHNPNHVALVDKIDAALVSAGIFVPGTFTDMEALAATPGLRLITVKNVQPNEIDFIVEPYGMVFPMPPGAEFQIAVDGEGDPLIDDGGWHISIDPYDVYYNSVKLELWL